jgi:hypothetical protein
MPEVSPLRQRMTEDMTVRNLSPATEISNPHALETFCVVVTFPDLLLAALIAVAVWPLIWAGLRDLMMRDRSEAGVRVLRSGGDAWN